VWERTYRSCVTLDTDFSHQHHHLVSHGDSPGGSGQFAATRVTDSAFGKIAGAVTPVFAPLGFGNWQNTSALMTGFVAKEGGGQHHCPGVKR
jgi:Fe2+ transport system protein B